MKRIIIKNTCLNSTCHGLSNIITTKNIFLRIVWILAVLVSMNASCFFVFKTIYEYFDYNVVTKLSSHNTRTQEFPMVRICNKNFFATKDAERFVDDFDYLSENENDQFRHDLIYYFFYKIKSSLASSGNITLKQSMGFKIDESFMNASFHSKPIQDYEKYFKWTFDNFYGNCFDFNSLESESNETKAVKISGPANGLVFTYFIGNNEKYSDSTTKGAIIMIQNNTNQRDFENVIQVQSNAETFITMRRTFTNRLPSPYSSCVYSYQYSQLRNQKNRIYRQRDCYEFWNQLIVGNYCNCSLFYIDHASDTKNCESPSEIDCSDKVSLELLDYVSEYKLLDPETQDDCPMECNSVDYTISTSVSGPLTKSYLNLLRKNKIIISKFDNISQVSDQDLANSIVRVYINYDQLAYTNITEVGAFTVINLISNIGGFLGLFLGMSLLSLFEFIDLIINLILYSFKKQTQVENLNANDDE
jgi:hypothetical protein